MEKFNRKAFKATSIKTLQKTVDKDNAMVGVSNNEYLSLVDGKALKIRIFPAHPGQEGFYIARKSYWLSFTNSDGESRRGTVQDSVIHGGTEMDIVDQYIKFAKKVYGKDTEKMNALTGTEMDSQSLNPQYSWLCYAAIVAGEDEPLKPMVWEFKKMVRDQLNKLAFSEDDDEPIEVDPFTDPDDGLVLSVKYNKKPDKKKGENYYEVDFARKAKKPYSRALTDDELESFMALKPLSEVLPKYNISAFDRALEGLQNWDDENDFNLFDNDEWLEIVEKVKAQYDASDDDADEDDEPKKKTSKKTTAKKKVVEEDEEDAEEQEEKKPALKSKSKKKPEPEPEPEEDEEDEGESEDEDAGDEDDEFTDMDRSELKKYIHDNDLEITVKKSMTDDDLRDLIREAVAASSDEESEDEEDEDDEDEDDEQDEKPAGKVSLADIRKKLSKK